MSRPALISYSTWSADLRGRSWADRRYWLVLLVVAVVTIWLGGLWPLLAVPIVAVIDYAWTCIRLN